MISTWTGSGCSFLVLRVGVGVLGVGGLVCECSFLGRDGRGGVCLFGGVERGFPCEVGGFFSGVVCVFGALEMSAIWVVSTDCRPTWRVVVFLDSISNLYMVVLMGENLGLEMQ